MATGTATGNATVRARAEPEPDGEVDNPTVWRVAIERYVKSMKSQKKRGNDKTLSERQTLANQFENFMVSQFGFPRAFYVHQVKKFHVTAFLDDSASRLSRGVTKKQMEELAPGETLRTIGAATMLKRISSMVSQARSVTMTVYTHKNMPSMHVADPFRMLKDALEENFRLPLDYTRLKKAADVLQHVRKDARSKTGFDCGWAPQNLNCTEQMLNEVGRD